MKVVLSSTKITSNKNALREEQKTSMDKILAKLEGFERKRVAPSPYKDATMAANSQGHRRTREKQTLQTTRPARKRTSNCPLYPRKQGLGRSRGTEYE